MASQIARQWANSAEKAFAAEIDRTPVASEALNKALIRRIQSGDAAAEDLLVRHNLRLVVKVVRGMFPAQPDQLDRYQVGMIALHKAAWDYDFSAGVKFSWFAAKCIRNAVLNEIKSDSRLKSAPRILVSLDAPYVEGGFLELYECLPEKYHATQLEEIVVQECLELACERLRLLAADIRELAGERGYQMFRLRYGLDRMLDQRKLSEVGEIMAEISRQAIHQMLRRKVEPLIEKHGIPDLGAFCELILDLADCAGDDAPVRAVCMIEGK